MKLKNKLFIIIIILFFNFQNISNAQQALKYVNIDILIKETQIGKKILNKINNLDKQNIEKLKKFEKQIQQKQNELELKKNIISENEYEKELNNIKIEFSNYKNNKNNMVKEMNDIKNNELNLFFDRINPVIQNYMSENSIDMIFNNKSIFIGNKNSDITNILIQKINNNLKND